jgi:hypothetical protein
MKKGFSFLLGFVSLLVWVKLLGGGSFSAKNVYFKLAAKLVMYEGMFHCRAICKSLRRDRFLDDKMLKSS